MMKKLFLTCMMVFFGLFVGVNTMRAQSIGDALSEMNNPSSWFYVTLEANVSTPACGSDPGEVQLSYKDIHHELVDVDTEGADAKPTNPIVVEGETEEEIEEKQALYDLWDEFFEYGANDAEAGEDRRTKFDEENAEEYYNAGYDWYEGKNHQLNTENPTKWGESGSLTGYTFFRMPGVDSVELSSSMIFSSYVYFFGKVKENDGWYFTGWSFTEGESDLGGAVDTDTEEDEGKLFKILPSEKVGYNNLITQNVYATFKPVMVSGYTVDGTIDVTPGVGNQNNSTVTFDVLGERVNADDFEATVESAGTGGYTGHGSCAVSHALVDGKIIVTITYTSSDALAGVYRANVKLASKSGCSELTAPVFVRVAPTSDKQASLYDTKVTPENFVEDGDLTTLIAKAEAGQIVALNKEYTSALSIGRDVTIDLNGYTLSNTLTVTGGNVVLAYNKYGGNITNTVTVQNGATLTLNGGTIIVEGTAVNVQEGGTLYQNGATIRATSATINAIAINVDGTATVTEGVMSAHAGYTAAFAVQVGATGKLTTTGGTFNASVDQAHNPTPNPADQSTWANAYAVYVTATTGEAKIEGGSFSSTSSSDKAFAVCALASFGKMTIEKKAIAYAHTVRDVPVAYAVGCMGSGDLTVNGGRFSATYEEDDVVKPCPPFLCAQFDKLAFNAGYIKADSVFVRDADMFPQTMTLVQPKLYNLTYKGSDYNEGYRYLAVREGYDTKTAGVQTARIGTTGYSSIVDALAYANNNRDKDVVIVLQNNDVLPAGYFTLPERATLIIPKSYDQETGSEIIPRISSTSGTPRPYIQPYPYVTLTMADGANVDVYGLIEVSGSQRATDGSYAAHPHGPCGFINMQEGSRMTMQGGSELRAWGFIIGKGETDVRRNATVREQFQMGDWKGGSTSFGMLSRSERVFPLTHYYIQNIESPFKYHPGAVLSTTTAVSATYGGIALTASANDIKVVGVNGRDQAIFLMDNEADADNTWVRKWYDVEKDLQVYDVNNSAHIGSMVLDLGKLGTEPLQMNSGYFVLPLTCNFKIHLLSGTMDFTQNTALLPGAEVEIDKEAIVTIVKNDDPSVNSGSLYIYDADQWDKYAYDESANGGIKYTKPVQYAAGFGGKPTARQEQFYNKAKLKDATINVHGTFTVSEDECYLYTSESGANIFSTNEDAGTFMFLTAGPAEGWRQQVWQVKNRDEYNDGDYFVPAKLRNGDGTYESTVDAEANKSYCYQNDAWTTMEIDEDNPCFMKDNHGKFYAKPADYVAIVASKDGEGTFTGNADHTFSDAAGEGRLFILMDACQWWEVEKKDNLYHCVHPNNDTYYEWKDGMWQEKTFTITWKNWDGTVITTADKNGNPTESYVVTYGTMAEFFGTNPTRSANIDYTYDFTGWSPALGKVTSDVTYTATYEQKDRMYTIIFNQEGGVEIERQFLKHNDVPVCENTPTKVGHTLVWSPAIAAVTGDATYTATWFEEPPTEYQITFVDYDGDIENHLLWQGNVAVGTVPTPPADPTGKAEWAEEQNNKEFTYVFDHWSPALEAVSATSVKTYTAVYREVAKTYTVTFKNGDETLFVKTDYHYGDTPECPADKIPADESDAQYTYAYAWSPQIQTVMGNQTYQWTSTRTTNKYTITLTSNLSGVCTFTGAGTFDYGTSITNVAVSYYNSAKYTFNGWSDGEEAEAHPDFTLTGDVTLTANFSPVLAFEDHVIATGETWEVEEDTEVKDLIITSDGSSCGQLLNPENLTIRGEAIYRIQQSFAAGTWYAVAVPWRVDPNSGIYGASGRLASGSQMYIIEFDGAVYANLGGTEDHSYWKFLHETGADMVPGKLYMIYLASAQSQLNFYKKAGAALQTRNLTVSTANGSAGSQYENWNAISNPALYTADLSTGVTAYQTYDNNEGQTYTVVDATTNNLIVAKPIFVQVEASSTVYATVPSGPSPAPRRAPRVENDAKFVVEISRNGKMADRLIIETTDEKEDKYVIGQDLAKFGVSSKVAQMWVNRYDAKLCANAAEMVNDRADYPLSIFAPVAGEYTIHSTPYTSDSQYNLYLTYNGEAIWNLSDAPYTLTLEKGTSAQYGLRISARKAPEVATGMDEAVVDAQGDIRKVLINDQVFIIRGEKVYSIDGQLVK